MFSPRCRSWAPALVTIGIGFPGARHDLRPYHASPLLICGAPKIAYDLLLLKLLGRIRPPEEA